MNLFDFDDKAHAPWLEMISDLVIGVGYSYSRIAHRIGISPSTVQKLATRPNRKPSEKVLFGLRDLHYKVFQSPYASPKAMEYWKKR